MQITTTPGFEGHAIREYKGVVTGEAILGVNIFRDLFAGIRDIVAQLFDFNSPAATAGRAQPSP